MEITEDEFIEKFARKGMHCTRKMLLLYEYELGCIYCGCDVLKPKNELSKLSRKKINFTNPLKFAEHKQFCICVDVYKTYQGDDFNKIYDVLSKLKKKKRKINSILIKKYKNMNDYPYFERNYYSRTAKSI